MTLTLLAGWLLLGPVRPRSGPAWVDRKVAGLQYETAGKLARNPAAAIKAIDEAIKLKPNNALSYYQKAALVAKSGNWQRADQLITLGNACSKCLQYQWTEFRILSQYLGVAQAKDMAWQLHKDRKTVPVPLRIKLAADVRRMGARLATSEPASEYCLLFSSTTRVWADQTLVEATKDAALAEAERNLKADESWRQRLRTVWVDAGKTNPAFDYDAQMKKYGFGDLSVDIERSSVTPAIARKLRAASEEYAREYERVYGPVVAVMPG